LATAQEAVTYAKSKYRPQVSFNGIAKIGLSGATNGLGLLGLPASPFWKNLADAFNVNQDIFDFGRTKHALAVARANEEAAGHNVTEVEIRTAERAKVAFLRVLNAERFVQVSEEDLRERQQIERKSSEFHEVGLSSKLELDLASVAVRSAELSLAQRRDDEQANWAELFTALGQPEGQQYQLVEPSVQLSPPRDLATDISQALVNRPDLQSADARIQAQEEQIKYARSLRRPYLGAVFTGGYSRFPALTLGNQTATGVGLYAPIYTGGGLEAQIEAERHNLEAIRAQYASEKLAIRNEVSRNHAELLKTLESVQANQSIARYAEEALRLARTRYEVQLTSFVELISAEDATEQARANYAEALYGYQIARARLDASVGIQP
jgi:outer membrane protein